MDPVDTKRFQLNRNGLRCGKPVQISVIAREMGLLNFLAMAVTGNGCVILEEHAQIGVSSTPPDLIAWLKARWHGRVPCASKGADLEGGCLAVVCPKCGGDDVRSSMRRVWEWVLILLGLSPFRCLACGNRFYRFAWVNTRRRLLPLRSGRCSNVLSAGRRRGPRVHEGGPFP